MVNLATNMGTGGEAMAIPCAISSWCGVPSMATPSYPGPGPDNIEGDGGSDTVSYEASELGVTVDLSVATAHRTVAVTGTAPDLVFPVDADPAAVAGLRTVSPPYLKVVSRILPTPIPQATTTRKPTALPATGWAVSRT